MEQSLVLRLINPYGKPKRGQSAIASKVGEAYLSSRILALQYPPGSGKTLAVLMGVLEAGVPKVIYLARTRTQFQAPLREVRRFEELGIPVPTATLVNKKDLCIFTKNYSLDYREFLRYCQIKVKSGICPFARKVVETIRFPGIVDTEALKSIGLAKGVCPFTLAWRALDHARIIVASYSYLFDEKLFDIFLKRSGIELGDSLLVVDEAHNLPRQIVDFSRKILSETAIRLARKELSSMKQASPDILSTARVLDSLLRILRKYSQRGDEVEVAVEELGGGESFSTTVMKLARAYETLSGAPSSLWRVAEFLHAVEKADRDSLVYASSKTGERQLVLVNINASKVARRVFSRVRAAVLMSATLPPNDYLVAALGLEENRLERFEYTAPWGARVRAVVVSGISSRYAERSQETYRTYGELIDRIYFSERAARALVVFPSYTFLTNVYPFVKAAPKIRERPETSLDDLIGKVAGLGKFLLMVVAWGKFSEGVELKVLGRNLVDTVIIAGLPLPDPSIENKKIMERMRDRLRDEYRAWSYTFYFPAVARVVQAIGRGLRSESDYPQVFVLDERLQGEGEEYLKRLGITIHRVDIKDILQVYGSR
ncbi:MAG: ATP-dependent DNA helicase [Thermofilum sp.]